MIKPSSENLRDWSKNTVLFWKISLNRAFFYHFFHSILHFQTIPLPLLLYPSLSFPILSIFLLFPFPLPLPLPLPFISKPSKEWGKSTCKFFNRRKGTHHHTNHQTLSLSHTHTHTSKENFQFNKKGKFKQKNLEEGKLPFPLLLIKCRNKLHHFSIILDKFLMSFH